MKKALSLLAVLLIVVVAYGVSVWRDVAPTGPTAGGGKPPATSDIPADAQPFTVSYVHDGDTLFLESSGGTQVPDDARIKVRLIGIDTPEIGEDAECFGAEATKALRTLAPEDSIVWGAVDAEAHDRYGRWLLYLWTADGTFVNLDLVENGFAEAIRIKPNVSEWDTLRAAQATAEAAALGRWGACGR